MKISATEEVDPRKSPTAEHGTGDPRLVRLELERMLSHPTFKKSSRCTLLFRHLVELALQDPEAHPKERELGYEVFGREPAYDTAADPIVRTTINEIRKRISVYLHEAGEGSGVRIELPQGSCLPQFLFQKHELVTVNETSHRREAFTLPVLPTQADIIPPPTPVPPTVSDRAKSSYKVWAIAAAVVTAVVVAAVWSFVALRPSKITNAERFWKPFLEANSLIIGIPSLQPRVAATTPSASHVAPVPALTWPDTVALLALRGFLDRHNVQAHMREADALKLTDLKGGPAILIGGLDNLWTLNYLSQQRFSMEVDQSTGEAHILDAKHPEARDMTVNEGTPFAAAQIDYSIVSRALDPSTRNYVMQLSGLGNHGSASAAEFAMNPKYMNALDPSLFTCGANLQFVLRTQIVNGSAGVPQVVATACW